MGSEARYRNELLSFKKHIKKLRKEKGLTQKQLKEKSTITQSQISLLENQTADSNPELETLVKLAFGFRIHMASLFDYSFKLDTTFNKKYKSVHQRFEYEMKKLGERILQLTTHRKLKQDELSILVNIDSGDVSRYINGDTNIEFFNITKIALALQVDLVTLFDYEGALPSNKEFKAKMIQ